MGKKNIYAGVVALIVVILLLSAFTLAIDYEYHFLLGKTISIVAVCNIMASAIMLVLSQFWSRLKESATKRYFIFLIATIAASLIVLFTPPTHMAVSIAFVVIIAVDTIIVAQLVAKGSFREEWKEDE